MDLKKYIRSIPNYPKKGILFRDITTLIKNPDAFKFTNDKIIESAKKIEFDKVAAIESRGFVFASTVSYILNKLKISINKIPILRYSVINFIYFIKSIIYSSSSNKKALIIKR